MCGILHKGNSCDRSTERLAGHVRSVQADEDACMNNCRSNDAPFYTYKPNDCVCCSTLSSYDTERSGGATTMNSCDRSIERLAGHVRSVQANEDACMNNCGSNDAPFYTYKPNDCYCCSTLSSYDTERSGGATTTHEFWVDDGSHTENDSKP